jgi:hypothetical protein
MDTKLVLIECGATLEEYPHTVYNGRNKTVSVILPGVVINLQDLDLLRTRPFEFIRKYELHAIEHFGLRK